MLVASPNNYGVREHTLEKVRYMRVLFARAFRFVRLHKPFSFCGDRAECLPLLVQPATLLGILCEVHTSRFSCDDECNVGSAVDATVRFLVENRQNRLGPIHIWFRLRKHLPRRTAVPRVECLNRRTAHLRSTSHATTVHDTTRYTALSET